MSYRLIEKELWAEGAQKGKLDVDTRDYSSMADAIEQMISLEEDLEIGYRSGWLELYQVYVIEVGGGGVVCGVDMGRQGKRVTNLELIAEVMEAVS